MNDKLQQAAEVITKCFGMYDMERFADKTTMVINSIKAILQQHGLGDVASERELRIMQLAGISTASIQNTESTVKDRITSENPYYTTAYADVCRAVDREMTLREERDNLRQQLEDACGYFKCQPEHLCAAIYEQFGQLAQAREVVESLTEQVATTYTYADGEIQYYSGHVTPEALAAATNFLNQTKGEQDK